MAPLEPERALTLLARLGEPPREIESNWKRRYTRQLEVVRGVDAEGELSPHGTPEAPVDVVRELHALGRDKQLSFGERALFAQGKALLARAIGTALGRAETDVSEQIAQRLGR